MYDIGHELEAKFVEHTRYLFPYFGRDVVVRNNVYCVASALDQGVVVLKELLGLIPPIRKVQMRHRKKELRMV
jgi:hypothetical protein